MVDVDEVLAMFMRAFEAFVAARGLEMRITRFALTQNIYRPGETTHIDMALGQELFDDFFRLAVEDIEPAPGAIEAMNRLAAHASVVILTNAPEPCRHSRGRWLIKNRLPYPLILNDGPKGPMVAALAARTSGPAAFIDDLISNLDSVARDAPHVRRFQMVADHRLRPLAFSAPDRHHRADEWPEMAAAIAAAIGIPWEGP